MIKLKNNQTQKCWWCDSLATIVRDEDVLMCQDCFEEYLEETQV